MSDLRWTVLSITLVGTLAFLQYHLWFESGGIRDMVQLKKTLAVQYNENDTLKQRNEELLVQIKHLQTGQEATESRARDELGMIKKGETFYQVVK